VSDPFLQSSDLVDFLWAKSKISETEEKLPSHLNKTWLCGAMSNIPGEDTRNWGGVGGIGIQGFNINHDRLQKFLK
jgi:hypothetical protein